MVGKRPDFIPNAGDKDFLELTIKMTAYSITSHSPVTLTFVLWAALCF